MLLLVRSLFSILYNHHSSLRFCFLWTLRSLNSFLAALMTHFEFYLVGILTRRLVFFVTLLFEFILPVWWLRTLWSFHLVLGAFTGVRLLVEWDILLYLVLVSKRLLDLFRDFQVRVVKLIVDRVFLLDIFIAVRKVILNLRLAIRGIKVLRDGLMLLKVRIINKIKFLEMLDILFRCLELLRDLIVPWDRLVLWRTL